MKNLILLFIFTVSFLTSFGQEPYLHWVRELQGNNYNSVTNIVAGENNSVYMMGIFKGNLDIDAGVQDTNIISTGMDDLYLVKYDKYGNFCWGGAILINSTTTINLMKFNESGFLYLNCGFSNSGASINIHPDSTVVVPSGTYMIIYDTLGNLVDYYNTPTKIYDIEFDYFNGHIYHTYLSPSTQDVDPGPLQNFIQAGHIAMMKTDFMGNYITAKSFYIDNNTRVKNIIHKPDSNEIVLLIELKGSAELDPSNTTAPVNVTSQGLEDLLIAVYDDNFNYKNHYFLSGAGTETNGKLMCDNYSNIFITGKFTVDIDLDPSADSVIATSTGSNFFITKWDSDFNYLWSNVYMAPDSLVHGGSIVDKFEGTIYTVGTFVGSVDMDCGPGISNAVSNGNYDVFLNKHDFYGNLVYTKSLGGIKYEKGQAIDLDDEGNILIGGTYELTVDFDFNATTNNLTGPLLDNIFFAKYSYFPLATPEAEPNNSKLTIYPNPTTEFLQISNDELLDRKFSYLIYDNLGKEVLHKIDFLGNYIDVRSLPDAVYIIQIFADEKCYLGKFVIEK